MKKEGVFLRYLISLSILLITLCFVTLPASATVDTTPVNATSQAAPSAVHTGWGDGAAETPEAPKTEDKADGMSLLLTILVSMCIVAFGSLCVKLFTDKISKKELIILLCVLIFVVILGVLALAVNLTGGSDVDGVTAYTYNSELMISWRGNNV